MKQTRRQLLLLGGAAIASRFLMACRGMTTGSSTGTASVVSPAKGGWATGGTASMTAKVSYPNPFTAATASPTCAMTCELIQGPCYDATADERIDISDGRDGLPMRVQLRLLDEACKPIVGGVVEVWHASPIGKYSGNDTAHENVAFCTENDPDFVNHKYFRGKQASDANGIVTFDTCFPGWYHGRAIHVHAMVTVNGKAFLTTQLCFDDALNEEICSTQTLYASRGKIDTTSAHDRTFPTKDLASYQFQTSRLADGALHAYKTLILRSSADEKICSYQFQHPDGPPPNGNQGSSGFP
jgi:protocatechuate 3,4-dioxygenase beta subunit